jgi:hypothetical protein
MEEKKGKTEATWKKCLQDANTCLYYDSSLVAALLLKSDALISLSRFEEAVSELESAINTNLGDDMDTIKDKLKDFASSIDEIYKIMDKKVQLIIQEVKKLENK